MNSFAATPLKQKPYLTEVLRGERYEDDSFVLQRESQHGFIWVLRDKRDNSYIDSDRKRSTLADKHGFTI